MAVTATPRRAAMASATSGPAATQELGEAWPATIASALAPQPGLPQPPQFAPCKAEATASTCGST